MSFINPAFFWAMFAVSVPIIIHLINFRRHKTLYFSNTRFLEDIKKETQTRTKLKHLLILLARILTIAMLVIAFAGPFLRNNAAENARLSEVNVIYIDNSFSMEADGTNGQLFEQAKQLAKEIVLNSSASMDYLLITNDMLPENQFVTNRDDLLAKIDKTQISANPLSLNDVILKTNTLIPEGKKAGLYIISDMQKAFLVDEESTPNKNTGTVFVPLQPEGVNNLFIDSCWFGSPVHRKNYTEVLNVRIVNSSNEDFFENSLKLFINDSLKAMSGFNIAAGQTQDIELEYVNTQTGFVSGKLEITDYPVTYDNVFYLTYSIAEITNVLIINADAENRYLSALFNSDADNFKLTQIKAGTQQSVNFTSFDIIILNSFSEISSGLVSELNDFVNNGGSVVFVPGTEMNLLSCNSLLNTFNAGKFDAAKYTGVRIFVVDYNHELYRNVFNSQEKQSDLPIMGLVHKHILYNSSGYSPVLRLENNSPVLSAGNHGNGKFYVLASPLSEVNSSFMKSPLFVPAFYNMALNSKINNTLYAIIKDGSGVEIASNVEVNGTDIFRLTDDKSIDAIADVRFAGKRLRVSVPMQIKQAGIYKLYKASEFISPVALNYDRAESVLQYYTKDELQKYITKNLHDKAKIIDSKNQNISLELKELAQGKQLWQLFLILAFLFILCEIAVARFMK